MFDDGAGDGVTAPAAAAAAGGTAHAAAAATAHATAAAAAALTAAPFLASEGESFSDSDEEVEELLRIADTDADDSIDYGERTLVYDRLTFGMPR